jgi:molybdopterin-guanine dinucleotide biosynthesis protein A
VTAFPTAAAILAGGRARRFGGADKSRLIVEGRPIIVRQLEVLQQVTTDVFVVSSEPARFADLGLRVYADRTPGLGVMGGLETALDVATADNVLAVGCDLPFLHAGLLTTLVVRAQGRDAAWVRGPAGPEPLIACYRRHARGALLGAIRSGHLKAGDLGQVLDIVEIDEDELQRFGPPDRLLTNVNTPDEYARVQYRRR